MKLSAKDKVSIVAGICLWKDNYQTVEGVKS